MRKIFYITRAKLSLSRAHTQNLIKTAEYLNMQEGIELTIFSSAAESKTARDIFDAKMVKKSFSLNLSLRSRFLFSALWCNRQSFDLLYFRDPALWPHAFFTRYLLGKKIVFEVHGSHEWRFASLWWKLSVASAHGLVFITNGLKNYYHSKKPSIIAHTNGIDESAHTAPVDMDVLRRELKLPTNKKIIMYVGSFLWHSIEMLAEISRQLPKDAVMVVVGLARRERINILPEDVISIERVEPRIVPKYLLAADILINPLAIEYPGSISSKLYEYLAAGKPIVSTRGGANEEILTDGENALVVKQLSVAEFSEAIRKIIMSKDLQKKLSDNARSSAQQYTWQARAEIIAEFLRKI